MTRLPLRLTLLMGALTVALLLSPLARAGSYVLTVTTTTRQDAKLEARRVKLNAATCFAASPSLRASCTQAEARAITPGVFVFADVQTMLQQAAQETADGIGQTQDAEDSAAFCTAWKTLTQNQQDNACTTKLGLPANCTPCR